MQLFREAQCAMEMSGRANSNGALEHLDFRFLDFFIRRLLDAGNVIACSLGRQDQFVEFQLQGQRVVVLRRLDQKDHQESHDCRTRVDDELPGIAEAKQWTRDCPHEYNSNCQQKGRQSAGNARGRNCRPGEPIAARLSIRDVEPTGRFARIERARGDDQDAR